MDKTLKKLCRFPAINNDFIRSLCERFALIDPVGEIFLFGSRAKETYKYYSDYDLLFLSDYFVNLNESERHFLILRKVRIPNSEWTIQPHCYTKGEWASRKGTLFFEEVESVAKKLNG
jgi:predicted nucleotidyltransferase